MTQGSNEAGPAKRSLRWKGRFSRTARQLQQGEEKLAQKQPLSPSDTNSRHTISDIASCLDNASIHSDSSSDSHSPSETRWNGPTMTKGQLTRNKDFHENFKHVPLDDILLHEFKCALQKDVLLQGRLYITKNHIYFKSNILGYITTIELKIEDIKVLNRVRTLRFMPRVIQLIMKNDDKYTFTSFLTSLTARDEVYYILAELWHQEHPPTALTSVASSASSSISTLPSLEKTPPVLVLPKNDTDHHESDNTVIPIMIDTPSLNKDIGSPSTTSPTSNHFKIFHRRRAQTVSAQNEPPNRERSATSSSTPLTKNSNGHISWMDDRQTNIQLGESKQLLSPATSTRSSSRSSILKKQKQKQQPSSSSPNLATPPHRVTSNSRPLIRNNFTIIFAVGGFVLLLSHLILTYEFYHVTQLFSIQQQQRQHYSSRSAPQHKQQLQDTAWISGQLQDAKNQAEKWEQETLRQRRQLLDLIPS